MVKVMELISRLLRGNDDNIIFNLIVQTTDTSQTVTITQLTPTGADTMIVWDDVVVDTIVNGRTSAIDHVYATAGTYYVRVARPEIITTLNLQAASAVGCVAGNI